MTEATISFHVYLLRCVDGSLYCGMTNDVTRRLTQHRRGRGARYTRSRLPVSLAWQSEPLATRSDALRMEAGIKRLSRTEKCKMLLPPVAALAQRRSASSAHRKRQSPLQSV